jgi:hypothetical protein
MTSEIKPGDMLRLRPFNAKLAKDPYGPVWTIENDHRTFANSHYGELVIVERIGKIAHAQQDSVSLFLFDRNIHTGSARSLRITWVLANYEVVA